MKVFLSVGSTANEEQEAFVSAIEERLRADGLEPQTLGRNSFTADAPLKGVRALMDQCDGVMVVALERYFYPDGLERRGSEKEKHLKEVLNSTAWNQIEASMGYTKNLPLMVVVGDGVRSEGLLEEGYDWYVQRVKPVPESLSTPEFNGILASWKEKIKTHKSTAPAIDGADLTIGQIISGLKPAQLWSILVAAAASLAVAFAIGTRFPPGP